MRKQNALKSTRKQRIRQSIQEQNPLEVMANIAYRLSVLEEKMEDFSAGDFDKVMSRVHDMGRKIGELIGRIERLEQQTDS